MAANPPSNRKATVPATPRMFANQDAAKAQCVGQPYANFFALNHAPAAEMAQQFGADVTLPLGLSALESGWAQSRMMQQQNNPFGATPHGGGTRGITYDSVPSAWRNWGNQWGERIRGVGDDVPQFVAKLLEDNRAATNAPDRRGAYNTLEKEKGGGDPKWPTAVAGTIGSVRRRLPLWLKSGC